MGHLSERQKKKVIESIMSNQYGYLDTSSVENLSFAVLPVDDFTGERPLNTLKVSLQEPYREGIPNNSGYYLFLDLDANAKYTIVVESDSDQYANYETTIDMATLRQDPTFQKNPVIPVSLLPNTAYPFSPQTTLIRGIVQTAVASSGANNTPVAGAEAKINERNLTYITSEKGDYIFYFKKLRTEDIIEEEVQPGQGKKRFIKMGTSSLFTLVVNHPDYTEFKQSNNRAEESKTTVLNVVLIGSPKI